MYVIVWWAAYLCISVIYMYVMVWWAAYVYISALYVYNIFGVLYIEWINMLPYKGHHYLSVKHTCAGDPSAMFLISTVPHEIPAASCSPKRDWQEFLCSTTCFMTLAIACGRLRTNMFTTRPSTP